MGELAKPLFVDLFFSFFEETPFFLAASLVVAPRGSPGGGVGALEVVRGGRGWKQERVGGVEVERGGWIIN